MKKIFMALILIANLHAISYEELLERAIQNNTTLEISKSKEQEERLESEISTRLENPNLELEFANFSSKRFSGRSDSGNRVGLSQSLLLPSVKTDRKNLGKSKILLAKQAYVLEKSEFIYDFSMKYLGYKEAVKLHDLELETLIISKKIMHIAKERYEKGTALKSDYLQAKIEHKNAVNGVKLLSLEVKKALNSLQIIGNIEGEIIVENEHFFTKTTSDSEHPLILLTQKKKELSEAKLKVTSHTIDFVEFFSEIEDEPAGDIFRVGVSIPLPIFNRKSEEKQLAKIEQSNYILTLKSQTRALSIKIKLLEDESMLLQNMLIEYESLSSEQNALLAIYQKGYGIAKTNLLEFEMSKKSFIENQEKIIKTKLALERNIVKTNYLRGEKND